MAVSVDIDLGYEFTVKGSFKDVFDVVSDVPTSASFFPKLDQLVDLGDGAYRWEMAKVGTAQVNIQTIYASKYVSDRKKGSVVWTPVKGVGIAGQRQLEDHRQEGLHRMRAEDQRRGRDTAARHDEDDRGAGGQGRVREACREVRRQPHQALWRRSLGGARCAAKTKPRNAQPARASAPATRAQDRVLTS